MDQDKIIIWITFIFFFILAIILVFLYFSKTSYTIDPSDCPGSSGRYSVLTGKGGSIVESCYGNNGSDGPCVFPTESLYSAFQICDNNPQTCQLFSFDGKEVVFLQKPLITTPDPTEIIYIKNY